MKTSILVDRNGKGEIFERAVLPNDANADADPRRIEAHTPRFFPAHDATAQRVRSDFSLEKPRTMHEPDKVAVGHNLYRVKRGEVVGARVIASEAADEINCIDREIDRLHMLRWQVMAEAWRRARPLRLSDLNGAEAK